MRPGDIERMQAIERPHGTRARYVAQKCRCALCRAANVAYYHRRQEQAKALAAEITAPGVPVSQVWTRPDGVKVERNYKRACPGVEGKPCPIRAHLRKDSKGGCCGTCRERLVWNGLVDAGPVRAHLKALSEKGVGFKTVADAASVAQSVCGEILNGNKTQLRAQTAKRILAVDEGARADHGLVSSKKTRALLRYMLRRGWTKTELARELGSKGAVPSLQIAFGRDFVTAANAFKVEKLHRSFTDAEVAVKGLDHAGKYTLEERLVILRRDPDCSPAELLAEYGHVWANSDTLRRDRAVLRDRQADDAPPKPVGAQEFA